MGEKLLKLLETLFLAKYCRRITLNCQHMWEQTGLAVNLDGGHIVNDTYRALWERLLLFLGLESTNRVAFDLPKLRDKLTAVICQHHLIGREMGDVIRSEWGRNATEDQLATEADERLKWKLGEIQRKEAQLSSALSDLPPHEVAAAFRKLPPTSQAAVARVCNQDNRDGGGAHATGKGRSEGPSAYGQDWRQRHPPPPPPPPQRIAHAAAPQRQQDALICGNCGRRGHHAGSCYSRPSARQGPEGGQDIQQDNQWDKQQPARNAIQIRGRKVNLPPAVQHAPVVSAFVRRAATVEWDAEVPLDAPDKYGVAAVAALPDAELEVLTPAAPVNAELDSKLVAAVGLYRDSPSRGEVFEGATCNSANEGVPGATDMEGGCIAVPSQQQLLCTAANQVVGVQRADLDDQGQISPDVQGGEITPDMGDLDPREIFVSGTPVLCSMYATLSKPLVMDIMLPAMLPLVVLAAVSTEALAAIRDLLAPVDTGGGQQEAAAGIVKTLACKPLQLAYTEDAGRVSNSGLLHAGAEWGTFAPISHAPASTLFEVLGLDLDLDLDLGQATPDLDGGSLLGGGWLRPYYPQHKRRKKGELQPEHAAWRAAQSAKPSVEKTEPLIPAVRTAAHLRLPTRAGRQRVQGVHKRRTWAVRRCWVPAATLAYERAQARVGDGLVEDTRTTSRVHDDGG
jgi:hypothetical protein